MLIRLYVNTALGCVLLFVLLAVWGSYAAIRRRGITPNYRASLVISQVLVGVLCLAYLGLRAMALLTRQNTLPLIYGAIAIVTLPAVRVYAAGHSPRIEPLNMALACFFTSGMVLRMLQTSVIAP